MIVTSCKWCRWLARQVRQCYPNDQWTEETLDTWNNANQLCFNCVFSCQMFPLRTSWDGKMNFSSRHSNVNVLRNIFASSVDCHSLIQLSINRLYLGSINIQVTWWTKSIIMIIWQTDSNNVIVIKRFSYLLFSFLIFIFTFLVIIINSQWRVNVNWVNLEMD